MIDLHSFLQGKKGLDGVEGPDGSPGPPGPDGNKVRGRRTKDISIQKLTIMQQFLSILALKYEASLQ